MKRCPLCGGELEERTITHPQEYKERIIILENVPAEVCRQCGEVLLRPDVLERVQEVVWSDTAPKRMTSVPVYDLAEVG
ncbi:MAG: type II toxin-antitoxin system MqsA family antitoxin [Chloroflexi bacterium]|nr:type II toxin-antitoxin system MqsA family antitoxin [Chloroflexota bacterium]